MKVSHHTYLVGESTFQNGYDPCCGLRMLHLLFETQFMELFLSHESQPHMFVVSEDFLYHGYSSMIRCRIGTIVEGFKMFGKEYSSDVTGDGHKNAKKKVADPKGGVSKDSHKPPMSLKGPATTSALKADLIENPRHGKESKDKYRTKYTLCDGSCDFVNWNHYHPVYKTGSGADKPTDGAVRRIVKKESENLCFAICHESTAECIAGHYHADYIGRGTSPDDTKISSPASAEIEVSSGKVESSTDAGTTKKTVVPVEIKPASNSKIPRPAKKSVTFGTAGTIDAKVSKPDGKESKDGFSIDEVHADVASDVGDCGNPMQAAGGGGCKSAPKPSGSPLAPPAKKSKPSVMPPAEESKPPVAPSAPPAKSDDEEDMHAAFRIPVTIMNVCPVVNTGVIGANLKPAPEPLQAPMGPFNAVSRLCPDSYIGEIDRLPLPNMSEDSRRRVFVGRLMSDPGSRTISNDPTLLKMVLHDGFTLPLHPELGALGLCKCVNIFVNLPTEKSGWEFFRSLLAGSRLVSNVQTLGNEHRVAITNEGRFNSIFDYRGPLSKFTTPLTKRGKITSIAEVNITQKVGYGRSFYGFVYGGVIDTVLTETRLKSVVTGDGHTTSGITASIFKCIERNFADLYNSSNQEVMQNTVMHIINKVLINRSTIALSEVYSDTTSTSVTSLNFSLGRRG